MFHFIPLNSEYLVHFSLKVITSIYLYVSLIILESVPPPNLTGINSLYLVTFKLYWPHEATFLCRGFVVEPGARCVVR